QNRDVLFPAPQPAARAVLALATAALLQGAGTSPLRRGEPWQQHSGWRMNSLLKRTLDFSDDSGSQQVQAGYNGVTWTFSLDGASQQLALTHLDGTELSATLDGQQLRGSVVREGDTFHVYVQGRHTALRYTDPLAHSGTAEAEAGALTAPMPGKIVAILVAAGARVAKGTPLLVMEAMKMEHTISATHDGTIEKLLYEVGDQVTDGAQLLTLNALED
ncbi:MAG: 3-methylcrotonyl-CoA carboxylase, partial [Burkholderiaceae bacterium]|nr:3-methylcrotonyl-CoA carboxylase [Burkholderiaceae bacterium]